MKLETQSNKAKFKVSNLRWIILGVIGLIMLVNYGDRVAIGIVSPMIMEEFGFSAATWGIILGIFSFGYAPFCFIGGWTSDKFGPRKILTYAGIAWSLCTALTAVGFNFVSFFIIRLFFGFAEGPVASVSNNALNKWMPRDQYGTAVGLSSAFNPLGAALLTPIVTALITLTGSWKVPFIVLGAVGILIVIGWYVVARDTPEQHPWITAKELAMIHAGTLSESSESISVETVPTVWDYIKQPLIFNTAFAFFGLSWVLFTLINWFPTYLLEVQHVNIKDLAITGMIPWIAGSIGAVLGGIITDKIGRKIGSFAAANKWFIVVCLMGVGILFGPIAFAQSATAAVVLMSVATFLLYLTGPCYWALLADVVKPSRMGGVGGLVHLLANIAGFLAPTVTGIMVNSTNTWGSGFIIGGAIVVVASLSLAFFGNIGKTPSRERR